MALDTDDIAPPPKLNPVVNLDTMSIAELEKRIAMLEAEISAIRAKIEAKKAAHGAASAFFKT